MSAPLPISVQFIFPPVPASNQPSPLASMVGFVSVKKPTLTVPGVAARDRKGQVSSIVLAPARAARRVIRPFNMVYSPTIP